MRTAGSIVGSVNGPWSMVGGGVAGCALGLEAGEVFPVVGGNQGFAGDEDRLEAVVLVGALGVEVHVVEEGGGVLEELVVERVLGDGFGEVGELLEGGGVVVREG